MVPVPCDFHPTEDMPPHPIYNGSVIGVEPSVGDGCDDSSDYWKLIKNDDGSFTMEDDGSDDITVVDSEGNELDFFEYKGGSKTQFIADSLGLTKEEVNQAMGAGAGWTYADGNWTNDREDTTVRFSDDQSSRIGRGFNQLKDWGQNLFAGLNDYLFKPKVDQSDEIFSSTELKQSELEKKYGYPNELCYATDMINMYRLDGDMSDTELDQFMKSAKDSYISPDGKVEDFTKMSKALAEASGSDKYYDYVYSASNNWERMHMTQDEFIESDYKYGMAPSYKTGDSRKTIIHWQLMQNDPSHLYNPGTKDYTVYKIYPVQYLNY